MIRAVKSVLLRLSLGSRTLPVEAMAYGALQQDESISFSLG